MCFIIVFASENDNDGDNDDNDDDCITQSDKNESLDCWRYRNQQTAYVAGLVFLLEMFGDELYPLDGFDDLGREVVGRRVVVVVVVVARPRPRSTADARASALQRRDHVGRRRRRRQPVADAIPARATRVEVRHSVSEVAKFDAVARTDDDLGREVAIDRGTPHAQQTR